VLEAGLAVAGGAKSRGAITPLAGLLVEGVKNLRSISGEILGSELPGAASDVTGVLVAVNSTGAAAGAALVWRSADAVGAEEADVGAAGEGSGGGRGSLMTLTAGGRSARKRNGAGPTTGR
jgi:hypothetical protein